MENSPYTEVTLQIFETLWGQGYHNIGVVLQSYLMRSEDDVRRVNAIGAPHPSGQGRLQGAEDRRLSEEGEVDEAFVRLMQLLLDEGTIQRLRRTIRR